jgi:hypothetical protein
MPQNDFMKAFSFSYDVFFGREVNSQTNKVISYASLDLHTGHIENYFHLDEIKERLLDFVRSYKSPLISFSVGIVPLFSSDSNYFVDGFDNFLESQSIDDLDLNNLEMSFLAGSFSKNKFLTFNHGELKTLKHIYFKEYDSRKYSNPFSPYLFN